ncbi:hypothetical protein [Aeromonas veronii]|uniref:hypothetical protein n=1 Tax=Aeromonas veronii TaxID=654 RepID=UPI002B494AD9|nr:hypothetical protein [Aeromonas veronii]
MKRDFIVASVFSIAAITGCSSAPKDMGQPFVQDKSKSVALNIAAYAGYPYMFSDNAYDKGLDSVVTSTSNAMLLSSDLAGSMGSIAGGGLGLGLGFITGLADQYPLDIAQIVTAKLQPGEDFKSADTVLRVVKANFEKRAKDADEFSGLKGFFEKPNLDAYVCQEADWVGKSDFDYSCFDPAYKSFNMYVKIVRPANGSEFGQVMPLPAGQYGVYVMRNDKGAVLNPKNDAPDAYFHLEHGMFVLGNTNTILPRVAPRDDGKRLVFIDGKATLI